MSHANAALTPRHRRPVGRDEHDHPGAMLHVDVKKLGNIPDGETTLTATAVLVRAVDWFAARGVTVAGCYTSSTERRGELDGRLHC